MKIDIILPYKEIFSLKKASAVSLTIKNSVEFSEFKKYISVFGQKTECSFEGINFTGFKSNKFLHFGNNNSMLINYLKNTKNIKEKKIIEIHNRPYVFNLAIKNNKNYPITLHYHNDPRNMRGSKTVKERLYIAKNAAAVYFVSEYIKNCFLEEISEVFNNLHVIPNGIERKISNKPLKDKKILFVGRLVPEKGCHIFVNAIRKIVKEYPDWKFLIIGTPKAGQDKINSKYANNMIDDFRSLGENTEYLGFIDNDKVKKILDKTSILVVPSIWQEPFALTALEGVCSGSAVIASKVGGMREMLADTGFLIDEINEDKLKEAILCLLKDKNILIEYQNKSWNNYRYNQSDIVKIQDGIRKDIFNTFNFK